MILRRIRAKFTHWSRTHHILKEDGRTLCGKTPTEFEVLPGPTIAGKTCYNCRYNNEHTVPTGHKYPMKGWGDE